MSARDDYPFMAGRAGGHSGTIAKECGAALDEIDRLRAELKLCQDALADPRLVYMVGPQRFNAPESDYKDDPDRHAYRTALRTRQIDITMQEDVRAGQRRLVEVDDAGNVVREFTEMKP